MGFETHQQNHGAFWQFAYGLPQHQSTEVGVWPSEALLRLGELISAQQLVCGHVFWVKDLHLSHLGRYPLEAQGESLSLIHI